MLGFVVPPNKSTLKKRGSTDAGQKTKQEMKRARKNESGREDRNKMKKALDAIRKFFGMDKATTHEILAKVVDEGE